MRKIIGFNPKRIYTIKEAVKRKLGRYNFELVGMKNLPKVHFQKPGPRAESRVGRMIRRLFKEKQIVVDEKKCVKCGLCKRNCPAHAITLKPYPVIDKKRCIRCYCCIEVCPHHALSLKK